MTRVDARQKMLEVALRLFAERGVEAVSLREVGAAAGQRNNSAAQYHFGSKEGLVAALIDTHSPPVEAQRLRMIEDLDEHRASVRELLEIFVRPLAEVLRAPSFYLRFLHQVTLAGAADPARLTGQQPGMTFLNAGLRAHSPSLTGTRYARRSIWVAQIALQALAQVERTGVPDPAELDEVVEDLLTTLEALVLAPA